jgi:peptidoglycan/LPS O-acetylase OafA/YrhL
MKLLYRPEIDGLRAVAVVSVVLYHLGIGPVTGGFIGVDVFFVISGYLITKIILTETAAAKFSFGGFYGRRARRLLPALIAATAATFLAVAILFAPEELVRTSASAIWSVLGLSNIFFWSESGYFDVDGILKPLLHTWSLAAELQFYLVWPAFIYLLFRFGGRRAVLAGILLAIALGTILSIWFLRIDAAAAFFLTPFRIHEFALGGLVVLLEKLRPQGRWGVEAIFVAGLAAIMASVLLFHERTPFPGYAVLLPAVGTALVIHSSASARSAAFLASRPFVAVGLISYSLYLVHWPLIVIAHYLLQRVLAPTEQAIILGLSLALAALSYRYVEKPFRGARYLSRPQRFYPIWGAVAVITLLPAMHSWFTAGWLWRFPADLQAINSFDIAAQRKYVWDNFALLSRPTEFTSRKPRVLVIGDSQAADLTNVLIAGGIERKNEVVARPIADECSLPSLAEFEAGKAAGNLADVFVEQPDFLDECTKEYTDLVEEPLIAQADFIIITKFWDRYAVEGIEAFVADLKKRTTAKIEVVGGKAFLFSSLQIVNHLNSLEGIEEYAATILSPTTVAANEFLRAKFPDNVVDLLFYICPRPDFCYVLTSENKPIYTDATHLTKEGAEFLARNFANRMFAFLK